MIKTIFAIAVLCFLSLALTGSVQAAGLCESCAGGCASGLECDTASGKCVYACPSGQFCLKNPLKACSITDLVDTITNFVFWIGLAIVPLLVVIAAFHILTSGGDPKKVDIGKRMIFYAAIGLAVILFAKGFAGAIKQILGVK